MNDGVRAAIGYIEEFCKLHGSSMLNDMVRTVKGALNDEAEIKQLLEKAHNSEYKPATPQCQNCGSSEGSYSLGKACKSCHSEI